MLQKWSEGTVRLVEIKIP